VEEEVGLRKERAEEVVDLCVPFEDDDDDGWCEERRRAWPRDSRREGGERRGERECVRRGKEDWREVIRVWKELSVPTARHEQGRQDESGLRISSGWWGRVRRATEKGQRLLTFE
jgi:hypothetical protein